MLIIRAPDHCKMQVHRTLTLIIAINSIGMEDAKSASKSGSMGVNPPDAQTSPKRFHPCIWHQAILSPSIEDGLVGEDSFSGNRFQKWSALMERAVGLEARGIEQVPEDIRMNKMSLGDYVQMGLIWFSSNLTANNWMIGVLGPLTFNLGLTEAMCICTFGAMLGSIGTGYISTFGPLSGNRTLVS